MFICQGAYDLNTQSHHRHISHLRNVDVLVLYWSSTGQHTFGEIQQSGLYAHSCWVISRISKVVNNSVVLEYCLLHLVGNSNILLSVGNTNILNSSYWCDDNALLF